ncbi:hypothetical protein Q3G72_008170 [Acer saccharum]|nr:hypothetical protein Q3G72_008170 [Acer saccharum]
MDDVNARIFRCASRLIEWNAANHKELRRDIDLKKRELAVASANIKPAEEKRECERKPKRETTRWKERKRRYGGRDLVGGGGGGSGG